MQAKHHSCTINKTRALPCCHSKCHFNTQAHCTNHKRTHLPMSNWSSGCTSHEYHQPWLHTAEDLLMQIFTWSLDHLMNHLRIWNLLHCNNNKKHMPVEKHHDKHKKMLNLTAQPSTLLKQNQNFFLLMQHPKTFKHLHWSKMEQIDIQMHAVIHRKI